MKELKRIYPLFMLGLIVCAALIILSKPPEPFLVVAEPESAAELDKNNVAAVAEETLLPTLREQQNVPAGRSTGSTGRYRLSWDDDPATSMLIIWDQLRGTDPVVYYGPDDNGPDWKKYPSYSKPIRVNNYRGMNNHFVKLAGLQPDTAYYFVIKDSETVSQRMWFRTAPDVPQPFTFISGGDTKSIGLAYQAGLQSNRMVPKLRPLFVLFGGDFTSGDGTNDAYWQQWLDDWATLTMTEDGRVFPLLPVQGNHEKGDLEQLFMLFGVGNEDPQQEKNFTYYSRQFGGDLFKLVVLNSCLANYGQQDAHIRQTEWLKNQLFTTQGATFKTVIHHKPLRPHTSGKSENYYLDSWAQLYLQHGIDIGYDNDSHMNKITLPIRPCKKLEGVEEENCFEGYVRDDEKGTMYVGEGSWGAWHRAADDEKPWTLYSSSVQQLKLNHVFPASGDAPARIDIYTVITGTEDADGKLVDHVESVGAISEDDLFALPENIKLAEIPHHGNRLSYPYQAVVGDAPAAPAQLRGQATSSTALLMQWEPKAASAEIRSLFLEQKVGRSGVWTLVDKMISADVTSYPIQNLTDGTDYFFRMRAHNIFGFSDYSDTVLVSTPVDSRSRVVFQQGLDYQGTLDLEIRSDAPDKVFAGDEELSLETTEDAEIHGLLRFKDLFGPAAGQIPKGAKIEQAELQLYTTDSTKGTVSFFHIRSKWQEDSTWNSLAADGTELGDSEIGAKLTDLQNKQYVSIDVTESLRAWQQGAKNFGWRIRNNGDDDWGFSSSEEKNQRRRPRLTVYFSDAKNNDSGSPINSNFVPDSQQGCAGESSDDITIYADQPFRIRFSKEFPFFSKNRQFKLQYRRNGSAWVNTETHDFPHPERDILQNFESLEKGQKPAGWTFVKGDPAGVITTVVQNQSALRAKANKKSVVGLYAPPWQVKEIASRFRLVQEGQTGVAFVVGYIDNNNFCSVHIDPVLGTVRVSQVQSGVKNILAERPATIPLEQWLDIEMEIDDENHELEVNFQDGELEMDVKLAAAISSSNSGFAVPSYSSVDFQLFSFAGEARTPRVSIVSCQDCNHLEWPVVVRRYADGAVTNNDGDTFEFRIVDSDGNAPEISCNQLFRLTIKAGHVGGTFVESPGRIGPWQASNGDLYFIMEPTETDNVFMMMKSSDGGLSWQEIDGANRPKTDDLESVDSRLVEDRIHIIHQVTRSVRYHVFRTSDHSTHPDTWAIRDEMAGSVNAIAQNATMEVRSDGSVVAFYLGQEKIHYSIRSPEGGWSQLKTIDPELSPKQAGPQAVLGKNDEIHLAYYGVDGTIWYRRFLLDGTMTPRQLIATGAGTSRAEYGAVLPLVHNPLKDEVVVIYRLDDGTLWERRIVKGASLTGAVKVTDVKVVTDAVDSQQAGADAVQSGETTYLLFIDESSRSILSTHDKNGWQNAKTGVDNISGSWVRGHIYTRKDGVKVYGYIYDAGSDGGAGMNRFDEWILQPDKSRARF